MQKSRNLFLPLGILRKGMLNAEFRRFIVARGLVFYSKWEGTALWVVVYYLLIVIFRHGLHGPLPSVCMSTKGIGPCHLPGLGGGG